jgi:hypothetical protein
MAAIVYGHWGAWPVNALHDAKQRGTKSEAGFLLFQWKESDTPEKVISPPAGCGNEAQQQPR